MSEEPQEDNSPAASTPEDAPAATVTIDGDNISIKRPVDEKTMAAIIAILFGAAPARATPQRGGTGGSDEPRGPGRPAAPQTDWDDDLTLGEFLDDSGASTFAQKICAAGFFLTHVKGADSFTREGVKTALADAREDMPANFTRDFNNATGASLIAPKQGETGQFVIPRTGRTAVTSHFQEVPKRRSTRRAAKKSSPTRAGNGD